ncbi:cleavage and polyadenylation specificity factor subunit 2 [Arctopsyche grandis]|uniref:cleavage and polyadenylation specificity factor subunit 2 n=1 Tax=Arctopsyche grandis TaxID=121162 RepID=UPI00406D9BBF
MTSIIKVHVISGAMDETPPCYVLQIDDFRILLDCGWDENFDMEFPKELKRYINSIDAVLISYPDPLHLGGLPYAVGKMGLDCPIYATIPVYKMGQMFMYDLYQGHHNMENFDLFTLDDVDAAFEKMIQLKYNQSVSLQGKGYGLTITPLPAGHMIGGTIWKIVKEEEEIVYATDFNHKKERHLNGCELEKLQRPTVLITDALNANYQQARRRSRDEKLMTTILSTLRSGGSVLVAADAAGRVLELAHMLDQLWRNAESGLIAYSLILLNNVSYNVVEFAKSQIEWMSDKLMRSFEGARSNPFQLRHLQVCHSASEVLRIPGPKVVLASCPDLNSGFSRELFLLWASQAQNSIVLTTRTSPGTLARDLLENGGNRTLDLIVKKRVKLEGSELEDYMRTQRSRLDSIKKEDGYGISSDSESDDDLEMSIITGKHDIIVRNDVHRSTGFFKSNKRQHAMFPFHEEKTKSDEYGEIIRLEDYRLAEVMDVDSENKEPVPVPIKKVEKSENDIDIPTKCIETKRQIIVNASIQYIDFEGRSDGESLLKIISHIRARNVICLRGGEKAVNALKAHCISEGITKVFTPRRGEMVDATTESHIYQVRLTDALVSGLVWQKGSGGAEIAWLCGRIAVPEAELKSVEQSDKDNEQENADMEKILTLEPLSHHEIQPHQTVFINELKLSDFKQVLSKNNIVSEFVGGVLWCCNGSLAIRRHDTGNVSLEGCLTEEYYKIRELLYEQYAIV